MEKETLIHPANSLRQETLTRFLPSPEGFSQGIFTKTPFSVEYASYVDAEMKKTALAFISVLLFSSVFTVRLIGLADATLGISILSPSGTYTVPNANDTTMDIPLIYTVNETSYMVKYSLVGSGYGKDSAPFTRNITLHQVPIGVYLLTVYDYNDMDTYAVSHFHVENPNSVVTPTPTIAPTPTPTTRPEPFPTTLVIGSAIAVLAVICLGLLVYLKKHHKLKNA
jgi:hypothetical protein